ncbi:hypothetical protein BDV40DRAFT_265321 [Aspergillus tamarii]|uniref:Uncharacterized protein n=1 Tax=Aspergillus tamarii TaxID=41984 RepID=A0A5N6UUG5_ASPTM|nr:hypothetical protein BDV40DRAFT_265321 [Aspergillus tamarii]
MVEYSPTSQKIVGEPALEGIHSDGSDHTMSVFFLKCDNMRPDSVVTSCMTRERQRGCLSQNWGRPSSEHGSRTFTFFETLVFVDHDYNNNVTSLHLLCPSSIASRDVRVVFTRWPKMEGYILGYSDSMALHAESLIQIPSWLP